MDDNKDRNLAAYMAKSDALALVVSEISKDLRGVLSRVDAVMAILSQHDAEIGLIEKSSPENVAAAAKKRIAKMIRAQRPDCESLSDDEIMKKIGGMK